MSRQPFITADLRPDLEVKSDPDAGISAYSTTQELAQAACSVLSNDERRQVERGRKDQHDRLMHSVPRPNSNVQSSTLDGETILLDLNSGRYYTLNRVGTAVWEHCTGLQSLNEIHQQLCARFDASSERIGDDLVALVLQLSQEGLLLLEGR